MNTTNNPVEILRSTLEKVLRQNECEMMLTGDEIRAARKVLAATDPAATQPAGDAGHYHVWESYWSSAKPNGGGVAYRCDCGESSDTGEYDDAPPAPVQDASDADAIVEHVYQNVGFTDRPKLVAEVSAMLAAPAVQAAPVGDLCWSAVALAVDEAEKRSLDYVSTHILRTLLARTRIITPTVTASIGDDAEFSELTGDLCRTYPQEGELGDLAAHKQAWEALIAYIDARSPVAAAPCDRNAASIYEAQRNAAESAISEELENLGLVDSMPTPRAMALLAGIQALCISADQECCRQQGVLSAFDRGWFTGQLHIFDMYTEVDKGAIAQARDYLDKIPASDLPNARDAALEEAAILLLKGSFLHEEAPGARLAREAAKAIRALKNTAPESAEPSAVQDAEDAARVMEMELALYRDVYGAKAPSEALVDVIDERQRQIDTKGWTPQHDDEHPCGEIAAFAAVYAMPPAARDWLCVAHMGYGDTLGEALCPEDWAPKFGDRRRELVKASALIIAEIERLDRATSSAAKGDAA